GNSYGPGSGLAASWATIAHRRIVAIAPWCHCRIVAGLVGSWPAGDNDSSRIDSTNRRDQLRLARAGLQLWCCYCYGSPLRTDSGNKIRPRGCKQLDKRECGQRNSTAPPPAQCACHYGNGLVAGAISGRGVTDPYVRKSTASRAGL